MSQQTYKVTGGSKVFGHEPGTTFTADLPPEQERDLIWGGAIRKVSSEAKKSADKR